MATVRIALPASMDRAAFDRLAQASGWQLANIGDTDGWRRVVFVTPGAMELIALVEDPSGRCAEISGHDPSAAQAIVEREIERMEMVRAMVKPRTKWDRTEMPDRPRLARRVHARIDAAEGRGRVILNDHARGLVLEIEIESWRALELADGTRDLDALCIALAAEGIYKSEQDVIDLFAQLRQADVLVSGIEPPPAPPPVEPKPPPMEDAPLEVLPGYTLFCDGQGGCCRTYDTVGFTQMEAMAAQVLSEHLSIAFHPHLAFSPFNGAQLGPFDRAVSRVDGACVFRESDGRCGIHRIAGPETKPGGCRVYPTSYTDDGVAVRVSVAPECACVFASVGRSDGSPIVDPELRWASEVGVRARFVTLPDPVPLTPSVAAPRDAARAWSAHLVAALAERDTDAAALAWHLADIMPGGLTIDALDRAIADPARASADAVAPWLSALRERLLATADVQLTWRSPRDLSRTAIEWMLKIVERISADELVALEPLGPEERFYLRALAHAHRIALEGRPLAHGLRDRALRLWVGRAMTKAGVPNDPAARYPLALLEASMRNLGLTGYADALVR